MPEQGPSRYRYFPRSMPPGGLDGTPKACTGTGRCSGWLGIIASISLVSSGNGAHQGKKAESHQCDECGRNQHLPSSSNAHPRYRAATSLKLFERVWPAEHACRVQHPGSGTVRMLGVLVHGMPRRTQSAS